MEKTRTNGYYKLPNDQWLHFSMNTWYNLKESTGKDITEYGKMLEDGSDFEKAFALAEIVHAAAKAYDQEEGNDVGYTIYEIRNWLGTVIKEKEVAGITDALLWNSEPAKKDTGKKQKG